MPQAAAEQQPMLRLLAGPPNLTLPALVRTITTWMTKLGSQPSTCTACHMCSRHVENGKRLCCHLPEEKICEVILKVIQRVSNLPATGAGICVVLLEMFFL